MKEVFEILIHEPYFWTPKEVGEMTLDELDLGFIKTGDTGLSMDEMIEQLRKEAARDA